MKRVKNIIFILALCFQFIAIKPVQPTQAEADFNLLKNTLDAKIHENKNFIPSKTELARIVVLSDKALSDSAILNRYASALNLPPYQLKSVLSELAQKSAATPKKNKAKTVAPSLKKGKAKTVAPSLKKNKAKKVAPSLKSDPIVTSAILKKAITTHKKQNCSRVESKNEESIKKQNSDYYLYIILDMPKKNDQKKTIDWQVPIDYLKTQLRNTEFTVDTNRHITLALAKSKMPFSNTFLKNVKKAISRAHEILKIVYQKGIPGISLLDGGLLLGKEKNVIAFKVAKSKDIKIMQEILLKFIAFEGLDITFKKSSLLHVTLGRVKGSEPANLEAVVQSLLPPEASSQSLGKNLISNIFRASYTPERKDKPYYQIGKYAF